MPKIHWRMTSAAHMKWHLLVTFEVTCISCATVDHLWAKIGRIGWINDHSLDWAIPFDVHTPHRWAVNLGGSRFLFYPEGSKCCTTLNVQGFLQQWRRNHSDRSDFGRYTFWLSGRSSSLFVASVSYAVTCMHFRLKYTIKVIEILTAKWLGTKLMQIFQRDCYKRQKLAGWSPGLGKTTK